MSKIVYKQRCANPAKSETPMLNAKHVRYIATRPGVVNNSGQRFGLFGKLGDMQRQGDVSDLNSAIREIRERSRQMTNMYRAIISMREKDALPMGFGTRPAWEAMLSREIAVIAREMNIPVSRVNYAASMHMERGHPHIHVMFWDKQQGIKDYFTSDEKVDEIRKKLIKNIFSDQFQELYSAKNQAAGFVKGGSINVLTDMETALYGIHDITGARRDLAAISADYTTGEMLSGRIAEQQIQSVAERLLRIASAVPKKGRLSYQFMSPEVKRQIDALVKEIIDMNVQCRRAMHAYLDATRDIAKMYSDHPDNHAEMLDKAKASLFKVLGNSVLKTVKVLNNQDVRQRSEEQARASAFSLLCEVFSFLSRCMEQADAHRTLARDELSRQARKEWAIRNQNRGLDWER